jgi:hypothetical protein
MTITSLSRGVDPFVYMPQVQASARRLHRCYPQVTCSCSKRALIGFGDSARTGVRHASSNRRIVCLSMACTSCRVSIVSWIDTIASLRYFRVISPYPRHASLLYPVLYFNALRRAFFFAHTV